MGVSLNLNNTNPNSNITLFGKSYQIGLVSISNKTAAIKVTNSSGKSIIKQVYETKSNGINGLNVTVKSIEGNNSKFNVFISVSSIQSALTGNKTKTDISKTSPTNVSVCKSLGQSCTSNPNCCSGLTCQSNVCKKCISKGQKTTSASSCCSKSTRYKWFWFKRYKICN
jgi:hypothetical protein